jgi:hypothetical protein
MFPHQQGFFPFAELQFSRGELLFKYLLSQCTGYYVSDKMSLSHAV